MDILMCCSMSRRNERERKEGRKERKGNIKEVIEVEREGTSLDCE